MFDVTDLAVQKLKEYLQQNSIESALRIALMQGGWAGPSLGLALDEPKENDKIFENDDLKFLVEEGLLNTCGSIKVEYADAGPRSGFGITSANPIGGGGGCSSGSCGSSCGWYIFPPANGPLSYLCLKARFSPSLLVQPCRTFLTLLQFSCPHLDISPAHP